MNARVAKCVIARICWDLSNGVTVNLRSYVLPCFVFFQAEDGIRDLTVTGVQTCALPIFDWLATELLRRGWSLKAMHRLVVTSATYRQDSRVSPALLARDPKNELLARGPRLDRKSVV